VTELHVNAWPRSCAAPGCHRTDRVGRPGLCHKHYERARTTGFVERRTFLQRVAPKIAEQPTGCWNWTAYRNPLGYGQAFFEGRTQQAHRAMYQALVGPIADGMTLDHLCKNPSCVNPDHLEPVTMAENIRRADYSRNGSYLAARTHCPRGHEYTEANTYWNAGSRNCRVCGRSRNRRTA